MLFRDFYYHGYRSNKTDPLRNDFFVIIKSNRLDNGKKYEKKLIQLYTLDIYIYIYIK